MANLDKFEDFSRLPSEGRILAIDLGTKWIGIAVSDESRSISRPVRTIKRSNWKTTLSQFKLLIAEFEAVSIVIGYPLNFDGSESEMTVEAKRIAENLSLSITLPVFLQDERATSFEARARIWDRGVDPKDSKRFVDSEAASIILSDFLDRVESLIRQERNRT